MDYSKFKSLVENLDIPWIANSASIYCPLFMKPKDGYIIIGMTFYDYQNIDWNITLQDIKRFNSKITMEDDYIILKEKDFSIRFKKLNND